MQRHDDVGGVRLHASLVDAEPSPLGLTREVCHAGLGGFGVPRPRPQPAGMRGVGVVMMVVVVVVVVRGWGWRGCTDGAVAGHVAAGCSWAVAAGGGGREGGEETGGRVVGVAAEGGEAGQVLMGAVEGGRAVRRWL